MASTLANALDFFRSFGLFDVLLPFLLVFTVVFAILEKTKILGSEDNKPKKNLNSMVSFVIALLVVAANKVVTALNIALPNIVLLLVISISFLLLVGVFSKTGELDFASKHVKWYAAFVVIIFIGVVLIFLDAIKTDTGGSWLETGWFYLTTRWESSAISAIIFLVVIIGAILYVTSSKSAEGSRTSKGEG